jgi:hypothetical protein
LLRGPQPAQPFFVGRFATGFVASLILGIEQVFESFDRRLGLRVGAICRLSGPGPIRRG